MMRKLQCPGCGVWDEVDDTDPRVAPGTVVICEHCGEVTVWTGTEARTPTTEEGLQILAELDDGTESVN